MPLIDNIYALNMHNMYSKRAYHMLRISITFKYLYTER